MSTVVLVVTVVRTDEVGLFGRNIIPKTELLEKGAQKGLGRHGALGGSRSSRPSRRRSDTDAAQKLRVHVVALVE